MPINPASDTTAILVLGAGELGMPVLRALSRHATTSGSPTIGVLLRPSAIASSDLGKQTELGELQALGVEIVSGDLTKNSVAELVDLFGRFDTVVSCVGFASGHGTQAKITQAVLAAGVRRYVPWQFGVDYDVIGRGSAQDLFDEQLDVRDLLRAQERTAWIIISTGMFTSFLFEPAFGVVDLANNTVRALGRWDNAVTVTTADDIGALTADILFAEPRIANAVVYVAGDTVTYARLADLVETVLGRDVERVLWSLSTLQAELAHDPDNPLRKYRAVFAAGRGVDWDMTVTYNAAQRLAVTDVATWAAQNLSGAGPIATGATIARRGP